MLHIYVLNMQTEVLRSLNNDSKKFLLFKKNY